MRYTLPKGVYMAVCKDSWRLEWLIAAWAEQRRRAALLLGRITDLGPLQAMTPAVMRKFLRLMDQVDEAKQKEIKIISSIDAIEEQHRFRRLHKQLRQACAPGDKPKVVSTMTPEESERPQRRWLWVLFLWYLLMRKQINQKNHSLTVD